MEKVFFPPRPKINPTIYVYELIGVETHKNYIKVGYTERNVDERIKEQLHTSAVEYRILYQEPAIRADGSVFTDKDVHKILRRNVVIQYNEGLDNNEWFKCSVDDVKAVIRELKTGEKGYDSRRIKSQCFFW